MPTSLGIEKTAVAVDFNEAHFQTFGIMLVRYSNGPLPAKATDI